MRTRAGGVLGFFAFAGAVLFWQAWTSSAADKDAAGPIAPTQVDPTTAPKSNLREAPEPLRTPEATEDSRPRVPIGPLLLEVALPRDGLPEPTLTAPEELPAGIDDAVRPLLDTLHRCVMDWAAVDPEMSGEVLLELEFGTEGLQKVYVLGHAEMPQGVTSCFAATLWEAEWPATQETTVVEYPYTFELVED